MKSARPPRTAEAQGRTHRGTPSRGTAPSGNRTPNKRRHPMRLRGAHKAFLTAGLFLWGIALGCVWGVLPFASLILYTVTSLVTFIVYAQDKSAAVSGRRRTPEVRLHVLSLMGGWPGALCAQQYLRHKSSKARFRAVYGLTVVMNLVLLGWVVTGTGRLSL